MRRSFSGRFPPREAPDQFWRFPRRFRYHSYFFAAFAFTGGLAGVSGNGFPKTVNSTIPRGEPVARGQSVMVNRTNRHAVGRNSSNSV
jgi:hypothetical protein